MNTEQLEERIKKESINLKASNNRIDIIKLANTLGIRVYSTDDIGVAAFIAYDNSEQLYEIYVNSNESRPRQRFSIAHEIAHYILHKDKICEFGVVGRQNVNSLSAKEERQADNLAADILMPIECIEKFLKDNNISEDDKISDSIIKKISKEFEVSEPVSRIRLRDMGYYVRFA